MLQSNEYDSLDRQTKHTFGNNSIESDYDEYGQKYRDTVKLGNDTLTYLYSPTNDSKRELKAIMIDNYYENVERDFFGRTKKISQSLIDFALTKQFGYYKNGDHATNRVNTIFYGKNGNTDGKLTYTYDKMGNVISVNENGKQRYIYKYDNLSRLIFEKDLYKCSEICYTYDNQGNILTKETNGTVTNYSYVEGTDRLASFGEELFTYENMGNPTTYRNMTATWEKGRQLKSLSDGANTVSYTYDAFGLRTKL